MNNKTINSILLNLDDSMPIYLCGHVNPDQDSVCSCLALCDFLRANGKMAFVLLEKNDLDIVSWQGSLNDYIKNNVENDKFCFIALDVNDKKRLGNFEVDFDKAYLTINIDHHENNKFQSKFTLSNPNASSTCEMIFEIISKNKFVINNFICNNLYCGILNDTNCFARRITNKTFQISQKLINMGIDYENIIKKTFSNRTLYEVKAFSKLVDKIQYDKFYYVVVDMQKEEFKNLTHNQIVKHIAEDLRKISTIDVLVLLIKNGSTFVAKVMTNKSNNANKICELFGGGGHKKEAGFTCSLPLETILDKIKNFI